MIMSSKKYEWKTTTKMIMRPRKGFWEPGEWEPKQPGSREQDAKMTREQGAEENNSGSHKTVLFYTILCYFFLPKDIQYFKIQGANHNSREQGDAKEYVLIGLYKNNGSVSCVGINSLFISSLDMLRSQLLEVRFTWNKMDCLNLTNRTCRKDMISLPQLQKGL